MTAVELLAIIDGKRLECASKPDNGNGIDEFLNREKWEEYNTAGKVIREIFKTEQQ